MVNVPGDSSSSKFLFNGGCIVMDSVFSSRKNGLLANLEIIVKSRLLGQLGKSIVAGWVEEEQGEGGEGIIFCNLV